MDRLGSGHLRELVHGARSGGEGLGIEVLDLMADILEFVTKDLVDVLEMHWIRGLAFGQALAGGVGCSGLAELPS